MEECERTDNVERSVSKWKRLAGALGNGTLGNSILFDRLVNQSCNRLDPANRGIRQAIQQVQYSSSSSCADIENGLRLNHAKHSRRESHASLIIVTLVSVHRVVLRGGIVVVLALN
jgi:hypothetical protein